MELDAFDIVQAKGWHILANIDACDLSKYKKIINNIPLNDVLLGFRYHIKEPVYISSYMNKVSDNFHSIWHCTYIDKCNPDLLRALTHKPNWIHHLNPPYDFSDLEFSSDSDFDNNDFYDLFGKEFVEHYTSKYSYYPYAKTLEA